MEAGLDDPRRATEEFDGYFGRSTYQEAVDRFLSFDLVIHRWDLARAVGLDDEIAPDDVERLGHAAQGFGDALRESGACGARARAAARRRRADPPARLPRPQSLDLTDGPRSNPWSGRVPESSRDSEVPLVASGNACAWRSVCPSCSPSPSTSSHGQSDGSQ